MLKKANKRKGPKVLFFDIETAPILGYVWGLFDQNVGLNQIKQDWHVLSWSAKWQGSSKIMYMDQRKAKVMSDDKVVLKGIWDLLDEADVVVTQNGKRFDVKKLNARFVMQGFQPTSSFKHIDTLVIAKKHFAFTSNKLEYMADKLNKKYKKSKHKKFEGFSLWIECLAGNIAAFKEMEKYNKYDVLALEELYNTLVPWDSSLNFNLWNQGEVTMCKCGSTKFLKRGFFYSPKGKFQRYRCNRCGAETRDTNNLFTKEERENIRVGTR
jgi:uncharacterized protein YprB with RNaseH-like and TPR domain